jgi:signal peptidase I
MTRQVGSVARVIVWLAVCAMAALLAFAFVPTLFGYESLIVGGGSMGKAMPAGSVALTRVVDAHAIGVGDVVSFRYPGGTSTITHRVVGIRDEGRQRVFTTKGDVNPSPDPQPVFASYRLHRVEHVVPYAGSLVRLARSPAGGVLLFLVPIAGLTIERRRSKRATRSDRSPADTAAGAPMSWSSLTSPTVTLATGVLASAPRLPSRRRSALRTRIPLLRGARTRERM